MSRRHPLPPVDSAGAPAHEGPTTAPLQARPAQTAPRQATRSKVLDDELLTIEEVMPVLKLSRSAVYDEIRDGHLPCVRVRGGRIRVKSSDLAAYITRRTESRPWRIEARRRRTSSSAGASGTPGSTTSTASESASPPAAPARERLPKSLQSEKNWLEALGLPPGPPKP